jgi:hypothetical protein
VSALLLVASRVIIRKPPLLVSMATFGSLPRSRSSELGYDDNERNFDLAERLNRIPALPGNPGSNLILVTEIEIQFVFLDESRKLPRIQQYDLAVHVDI